MKIKTGRTPSYLATIKLDDPADLKFLEETREKIHAHNVLMTTLYKNSHNSGSWQYCKGDDGHYHRVWIENPSHLRVCVKGRKPKVKKTFTYNGKTHTVGYTWAGDVVGGLENASEADIYIYDRSR